LDEAALFNERWGEIDMLFRLLLSEFQRLHRPKAYQIHHINLRWPDVYQSIMTQRFYAGHNSLVLVKSAEGDLP
jgi:hypothetical protein